MVVQKFSIEFQKTEVFNTLSIECSSLHTQQNQIFIFDQVPTRLEFWIKGKTAKDTVMENGNIVNDACVGIVAMYVDDIQIEILSLEDLMWFEPDYDQSQIDYAKQNGINLLKKINNHTMFYNNGKLCFDFSKFYQTYNKNLLNGISNFNPWVMHSHLGYVSDSDLNELRLIHKTLCNTKKS